MLELRHGNPKGGIIPELKHQVMVGAVPSYLFCFGGRSARVHVSTAVTVIVDYQPMQTT